MADIFISNASEDQDLIEDYVINALVETDEAWTVRTSYDEYSDGDSDDDISLAECVIVAWSRSSVDSPHVIDDARTAKKEKKLIQVRLEDCSIPKEFRSVSRINLTVPSEFLAETVRRKVVPEVKKVIAQSAKRRSAMPKKPDFEQHEDWAVDHRPVHHVGSGSATSGWSLMWQTFGFSMALLVFASAIFLAARFVTGFELGTSNGGSNVSGRNSTSNISHASGSYSPLMDWTCPSKDPNFFKKHPERCVKLVLVKSDSFLMGTDLDADLPEELQSYRSEFLDATPKHGVKIANDFWVSNVAVTFDQWDACALDGGCNRYQPFDEGWGRGSRPVINISWTDAHAYIRWLSSKSGKPMRLLSESEWEYMARGGHQIPDERQGVSFYEVANKAGELRPLNVSSPKLHLANFRPLNKETAGRTCFFRNRTVPQFVDPVPYIDQIDADCVSQSDGKLHNELITSVNAVGVQFVHGNVWEWVSDCYYGSYEGAPLDGSPRIDLENCQQRVLRGGSFGSAEHQIRADYRMNKEPGTRNQTIGFRVAYTHQEEKTSSGSWGLSGNRRNN